jgi:hypothetical protein
MKSKFPSIEIAGTELVLDASVLINLLGTGAAMPILGCLPNAILIEERALSEVQRHPLPGGNLQAEITALLECGLLEKRTMTQRAVDLFMELTSDDLMGGLDDGEAATIAYAITISENAYAVIDERKAARLFSSRWPRRSLVDTVTLLAQPNCRSHLGPQMLADACFSALAYAKMRVNREAITWVIEMIGHERARQCPSLGNAGLLKMDLKQRA